LLNFIEFYEIRQDRYGPIFYYDQNLKTLQLSKQNEQQKPDLDRRTELSSSQVVVKNPTGKTSSEKLNLQATTLRTWSIGWKQDRRDSPVTAARTRHESKQHAKPGRAGTGGSYKTQPGNTKD
jgi:hypothetical protein